VILVRGQIFALLRPFQGEAPGMVNDNNNNYQAALCRRANVVPEGFSLKVPVAASR
jgi:hypothetical protein